MQQFENESIFTISVDNAARETLLGAGKWARFIGISIAIVLGLFIILMLALGASLPYLIPKFSPNTPVISSGVMTAVMLFYGVAIVSVYFYPVFALIKFGAVMKTALVSGSQEKFQEALNYLLRHFKYIGILMIIGMAFYALVILGVLATGSMFMH